MTTFRLIDDPEYNLAPSLDAYPSAPKTPPNPLRCRCCGRFKGLVNGVRRCSLEVPVERGWLWEHL